MPRLPKSILEALPVDAALPEILERLRRDGALVLEAEPGAGKTTRVPAALSRESTGDVLVSEPRRLSARLAAHRVARELGEPVGQSVGYRVRFEDVTSAATRLCFMTDGVLLRRLAADPALHGVSAVVIDELHERSVNGDLALALIKELRRTTRPDLRLLVMSATLDGDSVASYLGCSRLHVQGRAYPLTIEHLSNPDDRPLARQVKSAVHELLAVGHQGDILVFLPGAREIRECQDLLRPLSAEANFVVTPLHGDLPLSEQSRALEPAACRKIIVSTNVAESSVTVPGVTAVIDSGLCRVATISPWTGVAQLSVSRISRASATQRAGRAGRVAPGTVRRLYTRGDFETRPAQDKPEIERTELVEPLLTLRARGLGFESLSWLSPPPAAAVDSASRLLTLLGALSGEASLSSEGRRMLALPVPPRLGRLLVEGERLGVGARATTLAALLSERDIRRAARTGVASDHRLSSARGPSDLLELEELFELARDRRFERREVERLGLDPRTVRAVAQVRDQLAKVVRQSTEPDGELAEQALGRAVLCAFVDRLARRQRPGAPQLILQNGTSARLSEDSVVVDASLLVALDVEQSLRGRSTTPVVRLASLVEPEWLLEGFDDLVEESDALVWNSARGRVERVTRVSVGSVVLDETRARARPSQEGSAVLASALMARGLGRLEAEGGLEALRARLQLLADALPSAGFPRLDESTLADAVARLCDGAVSLEEVEPLDLTTGVLQLLTPEQRQILERDAPERINLAGGRSLTVHYEANKAPFVESRLQDFFGMSEGPALCRGRVPLTLHLLAPNGRAVQITQDLAGFWQRHYSEVRRELQRRYPRHPWPEDGRTAVPPKPGRIR